MAGKKFNMSDLLNEQSIVKEDGGTYEIRLIPLDDLIPSPDNNYSMEGIDDLADSIQQVGLLQNLYVKEPDENGKYMIISGHRRREALKLNVERGHEEWAKAPCHVDGCQDPLLNELKLLEANAQARVLTQADQAYQAKRRAAIYQELKERGVPIKGRVRELVAKEMGVSPAQVSRYESINDNLNKGLKEAFQAERIGVTDAYDLSTMTEKEQAQVLEEFKATGKLINPKKEARKEAKRLTPSPAMDKPVQEPEEVAVDETDNGPRTAVLAEAEKSAPVAADGQPEDEKAAPVAGDTGKVIKGIDWGRKPDKSIYEVICPNPDCLYRVGDSKKCILGGKVTAWMEENGFILKQQKCPPMSILCPYYTQKNEQEEGYCPVCGAAIEKLTMQ